MRLHFGEKLCLSENQVWLGLVRIPTGEDGIGQNSFKSSQDWSEFTHGWARRIQIVSGKGRIGQSSFRNRLDWSELQELLAK